MNSGDIRQSFLEFFNERGHTTVPSSSLVPHDDPSVLLTTAGMQQFKPYFTGGRDALRDFGTNRTASVQKSFRTTDIDEVGDESHLTFFEMLGNFSFNGDYFKREAITWAYEFLTDVCGVSKDRIYVTVFEGAKEDNWDVPFDQESYDLWKQIGFDDKDIRRAGREDNFWGPTGDEGPCGPTTEIYIDGVEIWNLVFNQYYMRADGTLDKLAHVGVDTGMGLERLAVALQDKKHIYETDLFAPLLDVIATHKPHHNDDAIRAKLTRVIADHSRASTFLIADGVSPSNVQQGYILRRLIRRSIRSMHQLGFDGQKLFDDILDAIQEHYGEFYPEIRTHAKEIANVYHEERTRFEAVLDKGEKELGKIARALEQENGTRSIDMQISASDAFRLFQSYGFPLEMIQEIAAERGLAVDVDGFSKAFEQHQAASRGTTAPKKGGHGLNTAELHADTEQEIQAVTRLHTATHLLQAALREILGAHVKQKGSDITPQRLRFDFSHPEKLSDQEKTHVEHLVNTWINQGIEVTAEQTNYRDALDKGAIAVFSADRYPDTVTMYSIGDTSKELCAGPHVVNTRDIAGTFKISKEKSIGSGIRRIEAVLV